MAAGQGQLRPPGKPGLWLSADAFWLLPFAGPTPFAEVRLGGLLGKGSFGSVYMGWRGEQEIAVKVGYQL